MLKKIDALRVKALCNPLIIALFLAPFLRPPGLNGISMTLSWTFAVWKIGVACITAAFFLARPRLSPVTVVLGAYYALALAVTVFRGADKGVGYMLNAYLGIGALCLLVEQAMDTDPRAFVKGMTFYLGALCAVNLFSVVLNKFGVGYYVDQYNTSFLGYDNSHGFFQVPLLTAAMLYTWYSRRPLWVQVLLLAAISLSSYITWSASGIVAVSTFIVLFFLQRIKNSHRLCNIGVYYAVVAAIFLLVVVLRVTNLFSFFIEGVLHKNLSLTGRIPIWEAAFPYILDKPILGNGLFSDATTRTMIGQGNCHDFYLQILMDTGLVGLAVYMGALGLLVKPLMRTRKSFGGYILAAGLFCFLLILEVEALVWPLPFYTLFLMAYHGEKIVAAYEQPGDGDTEGRLTS